MELRAPGIVLRPPRPEDAGAIVEAMGDPEISRFIPGIPSPYGRRHAEEFLAPKIQQWVEQDPAEAPPSASPERCGYLFAVTDERSEELLGMVELRLVEGGSVGYWLRPESRGRGVMTEAVTAVVGWAHEQGIRKLVLYTHPENRASQRVAHKAGFSFVGTFDDHVPFRDGTTRAFRFERSDEATEYRFRPEGYLETFRAEIHDFDELQEAVGAATRGFDVRRALELGIGTGETARRVLAQHADADLVGIDESPEMLAAAATSLPTDRATLERRRLQEALPAGPFDLVFSALAVHHLNPGEKADLFRRVAEILAPGGRFVLGDVVVPEHPDDVVLGLTPGFDLPDTTADQLRWLRDAGFEPRVTWSHQDLAVISAEQS